MSINSPLPRQMEGRLSMYLDTITLRNRLDHKIVCGKETESDVRHLGS